MQRLRSALAGVGVWAALLATALFVPPPSAVLVKIAKTFPAALMTGSDRDTGATRLTKRALQVYVQSALGAYVADTIDAAGQSDSVVLARTLAAVRARVLTQAQVPHASRTWTSLASGFGYCDQVNAAAAQVASHFFARAQIYALYDRTQQTSPHTIGRVWSDERRGWLYFDAFFDEPVIFERSAAGALHFLDVDAERLASRGPAPADIYTLPGWVMNEYAATVGGQIGEKVLAALGWGAIEPAPTLVPLGPIPEFRDVRDQHAFARVVGVYAAARIDHLLGKPTSRAEYLSVAADPSASRDTRATEFAAAARFFTTAQ